LRAEIEVRGLRAAGTYRLRDCFVAGRSRHPCLSRHSYISVHRAARNDWSSFGSFSGFS